VGVSAEQTVLTEVRQSASEASTEEARECLNRLREKTGNYDHTLFFLRLLVWRQGVSLADIGTSEHELDELRLENSKYAAELCLDELRTGTLLYDHTLEKMRNHLRLGYWSLADIGTSKNELDSLRYSNRRFVAAAYLDSLRHGTIYYNPMMASLRSNLSHGGYLLTDIGASEEELADLWRQNCKFSAEVSLTNLKEGRLPCDVALAGLRRHIFLGNLSLADVSVDEAELRRIVRQARRRQH